MTTTTITNVGDSPAIVRVSYQGFDRTTLLSPDERWFFPVRIPRENIFFDPDAQIVVEYNPDEDQPLPITHLTFGGILCRRGRFLVPGYRGDGHNQ